MAHENFYHICLCITFLCFSFTKNSKTRKRFLISQITTSFKNTRGSYIFYLTLVPTVKPVNGNQKTLERSTKMA